MRTLGIVLAALMLFIGSGHSTAANGPMTDEQFRFELDRIRDTLFSVWNKEIKDAINLVAPYRGKASTLELEWETCRMIPYYEANSYPPSIRQSPDAIAVISYLQQAILVYIVGTKVVSEPAKVDTYVRDVLRPLVRVRQKNCITKIDPGELSLQEVKRKSFFNGWDLARYNALVVELKNKPAAVGMGHQVGAIPLFFALLHEAGHHVLHQRWSGDKNEREVQADDFAIAVFRANKVSVTMGVPYLQLFSDATDERALQCRMARIAQQDTDLQTTLAQYPLVFRERVEKLRDYYIDTYQKSCE